LDKGFPTEDKYCKRWRENPHREIFLSGGTRSKKAKSNSMKEVAGFALQDGPESRGRETVFVAGRESICLAPE